VKVRRMEGGKERRVLTALIVSKEVLSRVASVWPKDNGLFASDWSNRVAGWCVSHFRRYGRAPNRDIETIFETWSEKATDKDLVTSIERYVASLSDEYARAKTLDPEHVIDIAEELFNKNHLTQEQAKVEELVESGRVSEALKIRDAYRRVSLKGDEHIDLFNCAAEIDLALQSVQQPPLVKYPGGLGKFFGRQLARDSLVGIMAAEKMGKSYWLLDIAYRGLQQGCKVAYFQVGDLSRDQIMQRLCERASTRPWNKDEYHVPSSIEVIDAGKGIAVTNLEAKRNKTFLSKEEAMSALKKEVKKKDAFRLFVYPNASVNIIAVDSRLEAAAQRGWTPDITVIDYADILAPVDGTVETRDQINQTWTLMRSMSQKRNMLLVTATQASAAAYKATKLDKSHFSNDKRKFAHITAMFAINQEDEEKASQVQRLNWLDVRSEPFSRKAFCFVANCLSIANPAVKSVFGDDEK
jgi:hypothetical protein